MSETAFHPEDKARSLSDRRLVACGWLIQSKAEMNLGAGLGVAVREFQTASGPVDYGLFVGRKLLPGCACRVPADRSPPSPSRRVRQSRCGYGRYRNRR